jgi:hypothetical protein
MRQLGMDTEFPLIFHEIGWENFWHIEEPGCKLLTAEFLCNLQLFNNDITFRMFNKEFTLTWKELSQCLGFHDDYTIDVDSIMPEFERAQFWKEISDEDVYDHPHTNSIQLPTLCFMHKWMGMTLFPSDDTRIIKIEDLKLMLAIIKRRKVSPVQFMMVHWAGVFRRKGDIEYCSLVT